MNRLTAHPMPCDPFGFAMQQAVNQPFNSGLIRKGKHAIMGDVVDWVHIDEEPVDAAIRPQVLTRTINGDKGAGGRVIYTFTPENGRNRISWFNSWIIPSKDQFFMMKGWADAPHITPEKAERMLEQFPVHQREMRF